MKGYLNNKKATDETITVGGWLRTGDIGYYDDEKYVFIVDRMKELIKVKGFQVAPAELENLLRKIDDVQDVAVIGTPHERFGEIPAAFIVKENTSSLTEEEVMKFIEDNCAPHKRLGTVRFIDEIPRSQAGKILRRTLRI